MNWIYDERTEHSRLMVGIDRYGITVRDWTEAPEGYSKRFLVSEGFYSWEDFKKRERCYCMDDGSGRMAKRIVNGAISLMAHWGGSGDQSGEVDNLYQYVNGHHIMMC